MNVPTLLSGITLCLASMSACAITPKVSIGYSHMLLLKSDGTVWAWGSNGSGQLGTGNQIASSSPVRVANLEGVVDVAARGGLSMALKADGTVWAWGNVSGGLSGDASLFGGVYRYQPMKVSSLSGMTSIAATFDGYTALATDTAGRVWAWGNSGYGELGDGQTTGRAEPRAIAGLSNVAQVSAANNQVVALRSDGSVVGWGYNDSTDSLRAGTGRGQYLAASPLNVPALTYLETGNSNQSGQFLGLDAQGSVLVWGDTSSNLLTCDQSAVTAGVTQPYRPSGLIGVQQIAAGGTYALFLDSAGKVTGCGANGDGQLGDGTLLGTSFVSPAKPGPVQVRGLVGAVASIAAGDYASAAIAVDGSIFTWGRASGGLAGDGAASGAAANTQAVPLSVNAGALSQIPATFAGTQAGPIGNATVDIGVALRPVDIGARGEIYLFVLPSGGPLLLIDGAGNVAQYDPAVPVPAFYQGSLPARLPLNLVKSVDLSSLAGATIFLGYGLGSGAAATAEMIGSGRFAALVTLN